MPRERITVKKLWEKFDALESLILSQIFLPNKEIDDSPELSQVSANPPDVDLEVDVPLLIVWVGIAVVVGLLVGHYLWR
jgi:hypothetical protein